MSQQMPNVPPYPAQNIPKRTQPVKGGTRRNPGLQIDFSPTKGAEMGHEGYLPGSSPYPPTMLRSPAYPAMPPSAAIPGNASEEVKEMRRKVVEYFYQNIEILRKRYQHSLQELFFLQHGGSLVDFPLWRRRPTPQWLTYQATHKLEDEIDFFVTSNPIENTQVQNIGNDYIALQHKFYPGNITPGNVQQGKMLSVSGSGFGNPQRAQNPHTTSTAPGNPMGSHIDLASSKLFMSKDANFGPSVVQQLNRHSSSNSTQDDLANAKVLAFNNSKEDIMLEAKREADILKRVSELRKEGLWSAKRLPKVQEPGRNKSHWDYVLEEMAWLATDFAQERRWKKGVAKKVGWSS
jgi:E1A-binding protein p400